MAWQSVLAPPSGRAAAPCNDNLELEKVLRARNTHTPSQIMAHTGLSKRTWLSETNQLIFAANS